MNPKTQIFSAILLSIAGAASGQSNLETNAGIQFNFSTPGAANLALGGAFLALANDATTAYSNPAGLTNIVVPEVMIEGRSWGYTHLFTDRGRLDHRAPTGEGIDTIAGLESGEADDHVTGLSFLSYVYPRKRWAVAVYRHELASFEANFTTQGAFLELTRSRSPLGGFPILSDGRLASLRNTMSLDIVNYGISAAYRLGKRFSLGLGLSYYDFSLSSTTERFLPPLFEASDFSAASVTDFQTQVGDDADWGLTGGFLWRSPGETWGLGGVYRQGPDFDLMATSRPGPAAFPLFNRPDSALFSEQAAKFHVPEVYGLGIAWRPTEKLMILLDYNHIAYSDLTRDFVDIFNVREVFSLDPEVDRFKIDDADELHLGFEYAFTGWTRPVNLRLGAWHEPDHSLYFVGDNAGLEAVYRQRSDETHYTAGAGISYEKVQVDFAFDLSDRISIASVSTVFRF